MAPNLLNQDFTAEARDRAWVGDITYILTDEGWLYLAVLLDLYNREVMRRDLSSGFHGALTWVERTKSIDLGEGYVIAELEAPPHFVGQTLRQLDVRSTYGVEVVLIKRAKKEGKEGPIVSPADYPIAHGDVLLLAGPRDQVKRLVF